MKLVKTHNREMIKKMTVEFINKGGVIKKFPPSKRQETYVSTRIPRTLLRG